MSFVSKVEQRMVAVAVAIGHKLILFPVGILLQQPSHFLLSIAVLSQETTRQLSIHHLHLRANDSNPHQTSPRGGCCLSPSGEQEGVTQFSIDAEMMTT